MPLRTAARHLGQFGISIRLRYRIEQVNRDEKRAFASVRDDLAHLYSLSYYPKANPNSGWRAIKVKLVGDHLKRYKIRTRNGYRPLPSRFTSENNVGRTELGSK